MGDSVIRRVGVQPLLHRPGRQAQNPVPHRHLDGLEIQLPDGARGYERADLRKDFREENFLEPPFWTPPGEGARAASSCRWHNRSLTSTSSRVRRRNR